MDNVSGHFTVPEYAENSNATHGWLVTKVTVGIVPRNPPT